MLQNHEKIATTVPLIHHSSLGFPVDDQSGSRPIKSRSLGAKRVHFLATLAYLSGAQLGFYLLLLPLCYYQE